MPKSTILHTALDSFLLANSVLSHEMSHFYDTNSKRKG